MPQIDQDLKDFLDLKAQQYEAVSFIKDDPIKIPHLFSKKEDIEIAGFLTATIAWGNRLSILRSAERMMALMDQSPHDFIINHRESDLLSVEHFVHRTFNKDDLFFFWRALQGIYLEHGGLEPCFAAGNAMGGICGFREVFLQYPHLKRSEKHVSNPAKGSSAKRLNMYLRWMVRSAKGGVDFALWQSLKPAQLSCPLDVHSGRVARKLGLLKRQVNDAKAVAELDESLRSLDPDDPVKYDFALFGLGVFEQF